MFSLYCRDVTIVHTSLSSSKNRGLPQKELNAVFRLSHYAIFAPGGIHVDSKRQIDANPAGLCKNLVFDFLLFAADQTLFNAIRNSQQYLHSVIPQVKPSQYC